MTTTPNNDRTFTATLDAPLDDSMFFAPGVVACVLLFRIAQSARRPSTRMRALDALIVALRPVIALAVESAVPDMLHELSGNTLLVGFACRDLRRVLPNLRVASVEDLLRYVARRVVAVVTAAEPMAPRAINVPSPTGQPLLRLLPTHAVFALLGCLQPLDARIVEVVVRMTHSGVTWDSVSRALGIGCDVLRLRYEEARVIIEDRVVDEIVHRQA